MPHSQRNYKLGAGDCISDRGRTTQRVLAGKQASISEELIYSYCPSQGNSHEWDFQKKSDTMKSYLGNSLLIKAPYELKAQLESE